MKKKKKITILIPCYNEEKGLKKVLSEIPYYLLNSMDLEVDVIVIDNNSTDRTSKIAKEKNIRVIYEKKQGKGNAIKAGFRAVSSDTKYVVMLDGDNSYKASEMTRLLEPLMTNFCDVTIGSRLGGKIKDHSFKLQNRIANWIYTFLVRQIYRANTTDVLSGYYAWKTPAITSLLPYIQSNGFAVEMEMVTKMVKLGYQIYSVPITYDPREGYSKLASIPDGCKILHMFFKNLFWSPLKKSRDTDPNSPQI